MPEPGTAGTRNSRNQEQPEPGTAGKGTVRKIKEIDLGKVNDKLYAFQSIQCEEN